MSAQNPVVEIRELSKSFDGRAAVAGLSLRVEPGEILGLLGPNGAGKTTLIHMLLGLIRPTAGEIRVFGLRMPQDRQAILSRMNFSSAYVQMPLSLTPRQNLTVFGRLYAVRGAAERAVELLRLMGIESHADQPTRALSSGQLSRLNLAKALLNDPELLLLDEPTASMDPDIAEKTRSILQTVQRERKMTLIYTSHNMREVENLATRALFLNRGIVAAEGSPKELVARYGEEDLERVFLRLARQ